MTLARWWGRQRPDGLRCDGAFGEAAGDEGLCPGREPRCCLVKFKPYRGFCIEVDLRTWVPMSQALLPHQVPRFRPTTISTCGHFLGARTARHVMRRSVCGTDLP